MTSAILLVFLAITGSSLLTLPSVAAISVVRSVINPAFGVGGIINWVGAPASLNPLGFRIESEVSKFLKLQRPYANATEAFKADRALTNLMNSFPGKSKNLSAPCYEDTKIWLGDLLLRKGYTLKMLDAFFKIPAGLSKGNVLLFGAYDLCLGVKAPNPIDQNSTELVQAGNYCLVRLKITTSRNTTLPVPPLATCFPRSCKASDVDTLLISLIHIVNITTDKLSAVGNTACKEPVPPQEGATATLVIVGMFLVICVWATVVHLIARNFDRRFWDTDGMAVLKEVPVDPKKKPKAEMTGHLEQQFENLEMTERRKPEHSLEPIKEKIPDYIKLILCFSIVHNTNRLFSAPATGHFAFLNGIRVMSMWWIMLGHVHQLGINFFDNRLEVVEILKGYPQQLILNANFAVDTFFLLSGLVITSSLLREAERQKNLWPLAFSYLRRIFRLVPLYGVLLLIYMFVIAYIADGPFPILVQQQGSPTENCKVYWWTTFSFVNNFIPADKNKMCMDWTWFLAADMQLFVLTPPIVAILIKFPKIGLSLLGVLFAGCIGVVSGLVSLYGLPLTTPELHAPLTTTLAYDKTIEYLYDKPWHGGICYIVGVALAVLMVKLRPTGSRVRWSLMIFGLGWVISTLLAYFAIFGLYYGGLETKTQMTLPERTAYAALARPAWALAIGWVIYACQYDYGFAVKSFLSLRIWTPLSRLTYGAFLIHPLILQLYYSSLRAMLHYTVHQALTVFLSQVVAVYGVAYVAYVLIEMPLLQFEKYLLFQTV